MTQSAIINVMRAAVEKAGRALRRDFGEIEHLQVSKKGQGDFVTNADLRAEKILFEELSTARPGYGFLLEEKGIVEGTDKTHRWIIDPLDGMTNFMHGIPHFAISVALERDGTLVAGIVYNPVTDELFYAERGQGAFANRSLGAWLPAASWPMLFWRAAHRTATAPDGLNLSMKLRHYCQALPGCAGLARHLWIWPMLRPDALTDFGSAG